MKWRNFTKQELQCSCCGKTNPNSEFIELMNRIQLLRDLVGFSLPISSGYRCSKHPIEAKKTRPGMHQIAAVDIAVSRAQAHKVIKVAYDLGFTGIGVNQKGDKRFVHLDLRESPTIWSY